MMPDDIRFIQTGYAELPHGDVVPEDTLETTMTVQIHPSSAEEWTSMPLIDDAIDWCGGHEITAAAACPEGEYACRDHCSHHHDACDAGRAEATNCRNQIVFVSFSVEHVADRWLQQRYKAERQAFIDAYHEELLR